MKKYLIIILSVLIVLLTGCTNGVEKTNKQVTQQNNEKDITKEKEQEQENNIAHGKEWLYFGDGNVIVN